MRTPRYCKGVARDGDGYWIGIDIVIEKVFRKNPRSLIYGQILRRCGGHIQLLRR
jgi:hypothetical protein